MTASSPDNTGGRPGANGPLGADVARHVHEPWVPSTWQLFGGIITFWTAGLGFAAIGGPIGLSLLVALMAGVVALVFHWASWS